jgi:hypothetical protein
MEWAVGESEVAAEGIKHADVRHLPGVHALECDEITSVRPEIHCLGKQGNSALARGRGVGRILRHER